MRSYHLPEQAAPPKEADASRLNVSLDTLCPDRFSLITRRGCLSDVLTGLEVAERVRFLNLKCNVVLIGGFNDGEIKAFVALSEHRPWEIRFIELMPMGQCADWEKGCFSQPRVTSDNISEQKGTQKHPISEIQLKFRHGIVGDAHAGAEIEIPEAKA